MGFEPQTPELQRTICPKGHPIHQVARAHDQWTVDCHTPRTRVSWIGSLTPDHTGQLGSSTAARFVIVNRAKGCHVEMLV